MHIREAPQGSSREMPGNGGVFRISGKTPGVPAATADSKDFRFDPHYPCGIPEVTGVDRAGAGVP